MTNEQAKNAAELRALCDAATPGPWEVQPIEEDGFEKGSAFIIAANLGGLVGAAHAWPTEIDSGDWSRVKANATLIAAARTAIPALLDEREELLKELDEAREDAQLYAGAIAHRNRELTKAWADRDNSNNLLDECRRERNFLQKMGATRADKLDAALLREKMLREALSELVELVDEHRRKEIARMLAGATITEEARAAFNASKKETGE
ncbi:MAG: hypothetical protein P4L79_10020 [Legionella sp.]|uniref:hypothetical protein n=1 Tax=Legionella sp. TaxID=459 RepID=UPI00284A0DCA|nr:hypothetical protein [Legionella sp.]